MKMRFTRLIGLIFFYYLSLNGLHESASFQSQFPAGSINYEKYYWMQEHGVSKLTKIIF